MTNLFKEKTRVARCATFYEEGKAFNKEKAKIFLNKWRLKALKKHKKRFRKYLYVKQLDTWVDRPMWKSDELLIQHNTMSLSLFFKIKRY